MAFIKIDSRVSGYRGQPMRVMGVCDNFLNIGYDADGGSNAYINDVRVSSGVAYSGNFTPPSSPFTV